MKYWRGFLVAGILAAVTLGLQWLAQRFSQLVDMVYPYLTREIQTFLAQWSWAVDFTVWQLLAMLIIVGLMASIVLMIVLKWNFFQWLGWVLSGASLVWLLHTGVFGLNYYSSSLSEDIRMESYDFTVSDMEKATIYFLDKANTLALTMPRDENGNLDVGTFAELSQQAGEGFTKLTYEESGSVFGGCTLPVKELSWADFYSSMGITGITMPITGEAAVNPQTPIPALPFTMCHEMAHRMCIATESDANFAAFLACMANENPAFQYSAYYMAFRYCYSALASDGSAEASAAAARISLQRNAYLTYDIKSYNDFFTQNRSDTLSTVADTVNDTYLKVSGDEAGTASYSLVSTLLVNWYIEEMVMPYITEEDASGFDPMDKDQVGSIIGGIG